MYIFCVTVALGARIGNLVVFTNINKKRNIKDLFRDLAMPV